MTEVFKEPLVKVVAKITKEERKVRPRIPQAKKVKDLTEKERVYASRCETKVIVPEALIARLIMTDRELEQPDSRRLVLRRLLRRQKPKLNQMYRVRTVAGQKARAKTARIIRKRSCASSSEIKPWVLVRMARIANFPTKSSYLMLKENSSVRTGPRQVDNQHR